MNNVSIIKSIPCNAQQTTICINLPSSSYYYLRLLSLAFWMNKSSLKPYRGHNKQSPFAHPLMAFDHLAPT